MRVMIPTPAWWPNTGTHYELWYDTERRAFGENRDGEFKELALDTLIAAPGFTETAARVRQYLLDYISDKVVDEKQPFIFTTKSKKLLLL